MGSEEWDMEYRPIRPEDIEQAYILERDGYPKDEAASYESLVYRQREAPKLFIGCFREKELIGFICSTKFPGPTFDERAMSEHREEADTVCIHSVCVSAKHRRQGVALDLLDFYIRYLKRTQEYSRRALLLCKSNLIPLYTRAGFTFVRRSDVQHGKDIWYEMESILKH